MINYVVYLTFIYTHKMRAAKAVGYKHLPSNYYY